MNECKCVECDVVFEIKVVVETLADSTELTYFKCPECDKKYTAFIKNNVVFELEKERDTWKNRIQNPHFKKKAKKEVDRIQGNIAEIMKQLKREYT